MGNFERQGSINKGISYSLLLLILFLAFFHAELEAVCASNDEKPHINIEVTKTGDAQNSSLAIKEHILNLINMALDPAKENRNININIAILGEAKGQKYNDNLIHYTGAKVSGDIVFDADGIRIEKSFAGYTPVTHAVTYSKTIDPKPEEAPFNRALMEPGSLIEKLVEIIEQVWGPEALVRIVLSDRDFYKIEAYALKKLSSNDNPSADFISDNVLKKLLSDLNKPYQVNPDIIKLLGAIREIRALDALIEILSSNENPIIIEATVDALGQLKSPKAIDVLIATLSKDTFGKIREKTIYALGELRAKAAVEPLIDVLVEGSDGTFPPKTAIEALGKIGDMRAVEYIIPYTEKYFYFDETQKALQMITGITPDRFVSHGKGAANWWRKQVRNLKVLN